jgi:hypothetical protein
VLDVFGRKDPAVTGFARRLERLEAVEEIRRLFAEDCRVYFFGGIYKGIPGVRRFYVENHGSAFRTEDKALLPGRLGEHIMLQEVITVAADGSSAKARIRHLLKVGTHESVAPEEVPGQNAGFNFDQWHEGGIYENEYVKENGIWKFRVLDFQIEYFYTPDVGWAHTPADLTPWFTRTYPADPVGPDELISPAPTLWPDKPVIPYHYPNPVTGREVIVPGQRPPRVPG